MNVLKIILTVIFAIVCVALTVLVLAQEGNSSGLGAIGGGNDSTFWGQHKGRSMEGKVALVTKILAAVFVVLAVVLNLSVFTK